MKGFVGLTVLLLYSQMVEATTFSDTFTLQRYDNQDGLLKWSTNWEEGGDNGLVGDPSNNNDVGIARSRLFLKDNSNSIESESHGLC